MSVCPSAVYAEPAIVADFIYTVCGASRRMKCVCATPLLCPKRNQSILLACASISFKKDHHQEGALVCVFLSYSRITQTTQIEFQLFLPFRSNLYNFFVCFCPPFPVMFLVFFLFPLNPVYISLPSTASDRQFAT